ncbi:MAG TPA: hypothetical protein VLJ18_11985 [Thermoanaerobaculia bacterium]|nr:hypothetical protein [Thermoanaerobaculia bacterium]
MSRPRRAAVFFGLFAAVQTFALLAERDRWGVLLFFTRETWLLVLLLWLKNLALAAAAGFAAAFLLRRAAGLPEPPEGKPSPLLVGLAIAAVLVGIALRWAFPDQIPPGLFVDPPFEARALLLRPDGVPWIGGIPLLDDPVSGGSRTLVSYLNLHFYDGLFRIFGRAETGFLAVSAVPGCLALAGSFWLAREVFGLPSALLGVSFVSLAAWPLIFSRWSYIASALIALALFSVAAALAALRTRSPGLALLSGACLGLSLHTHASSWGVAAGLGVFSLFALRRRESRPIVAAAWFAALVAFAPFARGYLAHPSSVGGRVFDVPVGSGVRGAWGPDVAGAWRVPATLLSNAVQYSGVLLWTSDPNPRNGLPGRAAVTPLLGVAALLGLGLSAARAARGDGALFALLLGSLAAGVFSNPGGAPNMIRSCVVVIPALLAAGWLVFRGLSLLEAKGLARAPIGAAGVVAFVLAVESVPFLCRWPDDPLVVRFFCPTETLSARLVRALAEGEPILHPKILPHPFVFDALSGPVDPRVPIRIAPRATAADLLAAPPAGPFWYLADVAALAELRAAGWRCARGIAPHDAAPAVVLARIVPRGGALGSSTSGRAPAAQDEDVSAFRRDGRTPTAPDPGSRRSSSR